MKYLPRQNKCCFILSLRSQAFLIHKYKFMAKTHQQKEEIINKLEKDLKGVKSLVFVDYYGLNVGEIEQLKKKLKEKSCKYIVAKKTLFNIVLKKIGLGHIDLTKIIGGLGLAYSLENEIMPIKVVFDFAKKNKDFNV